MAYLLDWTGFPLADVGIAAVCAMTNKRGPSELTFEDLDQAAREMRAVYFGGAWISYLTCVFPNSEYVQPGDPVKKAAVRQAYFERVLMAHRSVPDAEAAGLKCLLSGEAATHLINRVQLPLITGEGVLNFFPNATGGFPIAGQYLTALQALPFGGRRAEGRLLIVHADSPSLTLLFARKYVEDNRRLIHLGGAAFDFDGLSPELSREQGKKGKMPQVRWWRTLVASDLGQAIGGQPPDEQSGVFGSLSVLWLSNSGQGASVDIIDVPGRLVRLLKRLAFADVKASWDRIVHKGWRRDKGKDKAEPQPPVEAGAGRSRNAAMEDLFAIYASGILDLVAARRFVRKHLLGGSRKDQGPLPVDWTVVGIILEELFGMSSKRIEAIKDFAERLVESVRRSGRYRLILNLTRAKRSWEFRNTLIKELRRDAITNDDLLFTLESYVDIFESDSASGIADWGLTRDLLIIRLFQRCHELKIDLKPIASDLVEVLDEAEADEDSELVAVSRDEE